MATNTRLVWDAPLRAFHWFLAASLVALYVTAKGPIGWMQLHFWLGYWTLGLLIFRVIWGFVGPKHARFIEFFPTPGVFVRYLKGLFKRDSAHAVGHNPVGALAVFAILILVGFQAVTGLFASDDIIWDGPYKAAVSNATSRSLTSIHKSTSINLLIALVVIHIAAVAYYWFYKRQNLVRPMITGRKPAELVPESEAIAGSAWIRAMIAILVSGAAIWAMLALAPPPAMLDYY